MVVLMMYESDNDNVDMGIITIIRIITKMLLLTTTTVIKIKHVNDNNK